MRIRDHDVYETVSPACIREIWFDHNNSLIITSNDGDMIIIPEKLIKIFLSKVIKCLNQN
jgi:hypothetical protein